jgi:D-glycero-alpha-D-manno-heptose-7-phosphate kinase
VIVSRAPMRITLGGGGTDLPSYYRQFGGRLVTGAIDKFVYAIANRRFSPDYHLSYMKTEIAPDYDAIKHTRLREALRFLGVPPGIDVFSVADLPAQSGLGSSGAFTVAALQSLHTYMRQSRTAAQLAEEACHIEMDILREPCGKQDPYAAALGGLNVLEIETDGTVHHRPVEVRPSTRLVLQMNTLLFYTGILRPASEVLAPQQQQIAADDGQGAQRMHRIKELGDLALKGLEAGDPDVFGESLHEHWLMKRGIHSAMSTDFVDEAYEAARQAGAVGGKLVGAGGGGFLLLYCPNRQRAVIERLEGMGLELLPFRFEDSGITMMAQL